MERLNRDFRKLLTQPGEVAALAVADEGSIVRFIVGLDPSPRPMSAAELEDLLNDPLATLLLRRGIFPRTLAEVLAGIDAFNTLPEGLPEQQTFLVGEGSQIRWTPETATLNRQLRFAITRAAAQASGGQVDLLISAATSGDPTQTFLQIMAWDAKNQAFNFYARELRQTWVWAGNSRFALTLGSRGEGPFDSHVNGTMVMKELRQPWNNWHSMNASISPDVLAPNDPMRENPHFLQRTGAEQLERSVVRPGVQRWNAARVANAVGLDGTITNAAFFVRQLFTTTTVNLTSSTLESRSVRRDQTLDLPLSFFINRDALFDVVGLLPAVSPPRASGAHYLDSLATFAFALSDGAFRQDGDTFFAFLVPEPAFEDTDLLDQLVRAGLLSRRFVACVSMVDFPNPIFSPRRAALQPYALNGPAVPAGWGEGIAARIVEASESTSAGSPEREFAANWALGADTWQATFEQRIVDYFTGVEQALTTAEGFQHYVRLAESRRREFRPLPLNEEVPLLLPKTNIPQDAPLLQMTDRGAVIPK